MADQFEVHDISCPALTPATAPVEVATYTGGLYEVTAVWVVIPDGHAGLTGIALAYGHQPVYPGNPGAYISGNDEYFRLDVEGNPAGVPWSVFVCNEDTQSHVWETRWEMSLPRASVTLTAPTPIPASAILAAGA